MRKLRRFFWKVSFSEITGNLSDTDELLSNTFLHHIKVATYLGTTVRNQLDQYLNQQRRQIYYEHSLRFHHFNIFQKYFLSDATINNEQINNGVNHNYLDGLSHSSATVSYINLAVLILLQKKQFHELRDIFEKWYRLTII